MAEHITREPTDISTKVIGGSLGAAAGTIGVWIVEHFSGIDVPAPVEVAVATVLTFAIGWLVAERAPRA